MGDNNTGPNRRCHLVASASLGGGSPVPGQDRSCEDQMNGWLQKRDPQFYSPLEWAWIFTDHKWLVLNIKDIKSNGKSSYSLWKTKGSFLIAWINSKQVSAHFICHLLSHPSTSICHIIQSAPFRCLGAIVYTKLGFSKAAQLFLSCPDKTGWLKRGPKKVLVKWGPPISFQETVFIIFVSHT
jgi:hypothetical protein